VTREEYHVALSTFLSPTEVDKVLNILYGTLVDTDSQRYDLFLGLVKSYSDGDWLPLKKYQKYKGVVVGVQEFVESPLFLDKKGVLYPEVMKALIELNSGKYIEAVITGGIGSAKTTLAQYTQAYQLYVLSMMVCPHTTMALDSASEILFVFQSLNLTLAKNLEFNRFKALLEGSYYFQNNFPFDKNIESRLVFPNRIEVVPITGAESAAIGQNVIGGVLDEVNYMAVVQRSKADVDGGTYDQAWVLYNSIARRRKSRFIVNGETYGMLCLVSSKRYPGQFTDVKEEEADEEITTTGATGIYVYDKCAWDIKPKGTYSAEGWFYVFIGDASRQPMVLTDEEYSRMSLEDRETNIKRIPSEYSKEFDKDIINSLREVAGVSTLAKAPYMPDLAKVSACFSKDIKSVFSAPRAVLNAGQLELLSSVVDNAGSALRFAHLDLSKNGDSTGLCIGHVKKFITTTVADTIEVMPHIVIDGLLEIVPPRFGEISYAAIRQILYALRAMGLPIKWCTFDSYQSVDSIQILQQKAYVTGLQSMDTSIVPYQVLKAALYGGRVSLPVHPLVYRELRGLEYLQEKMKVDHPANGSKDLADALAGVVYGLTMRKEIWASHGITREDIPSALLLQLTSNDG
jgi:hypothetical protein